MNLKSANSRLLTQAELKISAVTRKVTAKIYTFTEYDLLVLGSKHPAILLTEHKPIIFHFYENQIQIIEFIDFNLFLGNFQTYIMFGQQEKNLALPETHSQITPTELITRKTTVEVPRNKKFFLAKIEKPPRI